mmetsp:Transcript_7157/g.15114  ORF Transcript_7157/g.15114 Transcript_7157/m.15114 type:complete len:544 (+) Transcript_7157:964-2595(+)
MTVAPTTLCLPSVTRSVAGPVRLQILMHPSGLSGDAALMREARTWPTGADPTPATVPVADAVPRGIWGSLTTAYDILTILSAFAEGVLFVLTFMLSTLGVTALLPADPAERMPLPGIGIVKGAASALWASSAVSVCFGGSGIWGGTSSVVWASTAAPACFGGSEICGGPASTLWASASLVERSVSSARAVSVPPSSGTDSVASVGIAAFGLARASLVAASSPSAEAPSLEVALSSFSGSTPSRRRAVVEKTRTTAHPSTTQRLKGPPDPVPPSGCLSWEGSSVSTPMLWRASSVSGCVFSVVVLWSSPITEEERDSVKQGAVFLRWAASRANISGITGPPSTVSDGLAEEGPKPATGGGSLLIAWDKLPISASSRPSLSSKAAALSPSRSRNRAASAASPKSIERTRRISFFIMRFSSLIALISPTIPLRLRASTTATQAAANGAAHFLMDDDFPPCVSSMYDGSTELRESVTLATTPAPMRPMSSLMAAILVSIPLSPSAAAPTSPSPPAEPSATGSSFPSSSEPFPSEGATPTVPSVLDVP